MKHIFTLITCIIMSFAANTQAQRQTFKLYEDDGVGPDLRDLNLLNNTFLMKQRSRIDSLTRSNFGRPIRKDKSDLIALQRVIDEELIDKDDTETLQALGVVLGDLYTTEHRELVWQVYDDGFSTHAVCMKNTSHCLFPITMLSRRIEAGVKPSAKDTYNKGLNLIKPYFPKIPYTGSSLPRLSSPSTPQ